MTGSARLEGTWDYLMQKEREKRSEGKLCYRRVKLDMEAEVEGVVKRSPDFFEAKGLSSDMDSPYSKMKFR